MRKIIQIATLPASSYSSGILLSLDDDGNVWWSANYDATGLAPEHTWSRVQSLPATPLQSARRRAGLAGGLARAAKLTPERRSEIARTAAKARFRKSPVSAGSAHGGDETR